MTVCLQKQWPSGNESAGFFVLSMLAGMFMDSLYIFTAGLEDGQKRRICHAQKI